MSLRQFEASLTTEAPPPDLSAALEALWWAGRGVEGWDAAHALVQDEPGTEAAWVHAHLHRIEGDPGNAGYWYRRAGRAPAGSDGAAEWAAIADALLAAR